MIQYIAEHAFVCMMIVAVVVGTIAVAVDIHAQRAWTPLTIRKGEIVDGLNADNPLNVLPARRVRGERR